MALIFLDSDICAFNVLQTYDFVEYFCGQHRVSTALWNAGVSVLSLRT